jgi:ketosteroid isomerase-like protein
VSGGAPSDADAVAQVAKRWEMACRSGDAAAITALLSEDATVWYNYAADVVHDRAGYRAILEDSYKSFRNPKYRDFRVTLHPAGFIEQATLEGETDEGRISAPFCLFATVRDGEITCIEEYFDSATLRPQPAGPEIDAVDIIRRYNKAWFAQDLPGMAAFLAEDLVLWHNHIGRRFGKSEMLDFIRSALDVIARVEFRKARGVATETGVLQQHELYLEMKDGRVITDVPNCIVYTLRGGKIVGIEEYVDSAALAAVRIAS